MIRLSICIPTYNRRPFLPNLLNSIFSQDDNMVEVVVSDNASTDGTCGMIKQIAASNPRLHYFRSSENLGADTNFLKAIDYAQGEFCWLMGSDDQIQPGGIERVLRAIKEYPNASGFTLNVVGHTFDMNNPYYPEIAMGQLDGDFLKSDQVFENGRSAFYRIADHFGYIGAQVIRKSCWDDSIKEIGQKIDYFKTGFVHVAVISQILRSTCRWCYIHQRCVGFRTGNDSFLAQGRLYRLTIFVVSFSRILNEFWNDDPKLCSDITNLNLKVHVRTFVGHWYLDTPLGKLEPFLMFKCFLLCSSHYWKMPYYWTHIAPFFIIPRWLTFFARCIIRSVKRLLAS